ncbi:MAG: hypothetical protein FJZ01_09380 [Candidatus Sericytochromatia bacterium]|nr:hypothetical protein [Candidatus Tanganyikabacteria bacterium]
MHPVRYAVAAGLVVVATGCPAMNPFNGNPFLPRARLLAIADDAETKVKLEQVSSGVFKQTIEPEQMKFTLRPYPNDITPGVHVNAYKIEWFDMNGVQIDKQIIPPRTQGVGLYLERGSGGGAAGAAGGGGGTTSKSLQIPVVTNPVVDFGRQNGFRFDPAKNTFVERTDAWSQFLTGRVTFSGRDDNGNPLENTQAYFTLRFTTIASASN